MLIIKLIRFLLGYVSFSATGGFAERFVNLCTNKRIPLWNMKKVGNVLYGETTVEGYKAIRQSAYRSGMKMKLERKRGLPFFLNNNVKRKGIAIGFLASMAIVFLGVLLWLTGVYSLFADQSCYSQPGHCFSNECEIQRLWWST